jgi:diguanylate cyclase (GGDEF)-like protein
MRAFRSLSVGLQSYIVLTVGAAAAIMTWQASTARFESRPLFLAVLIASVGLAATKIRLPLLPSTATVSLSYCTNFAALALFSRFEATFIIAVSVWSQCVLNTTGRTATYRTVFSIANIVVAAEAAGQASDWLGGLAPGRGWSTLSVATLAGATAFFFCNTLLMAGAVALESRRSPARLWREQLLWTAPACFLGAGVGICAAYLIATANVVAAVALVPAVLFYWASRTYLSFIERQEALHMSTVEALARAIGARDQTLEASRTVPESHVRRVQWLALELARRAGMTPDELKGVRIAMMLHDIGKLAVPEYILNKPGRLAEEEYKLVQMHPTIGAEIISAVDFGYPVAELIASHHERWNGAGYPKGLRGEEIPLGSRILGIVDYYDALVADRPYHRARTEGEARRIIRAEAGEVLDPRLVTMFLAILEEETPLESIAGPDDETMPVRLVPAPASMPMSATPIAGAIENIARANTEMAALYELTEAMGSRLSVSDTMALLVSRLTKLVPASSWALFICDETTGASRCTFASGLDSELLLELEVPAGTGVVGYLSRGGQVVRNVPPDADFASAGVAGGESRLQSMIACPLLLHGRTVGALAAYHVTPDYFTTAHESTLEKVAPKAAIVVHDARTFEKVRTESLTDALTSLPNSRALTEHLEREMSKADRYHTERALLVIDVDGFKKINDRFGHPAGDRALQFVSRAIRGSVRVYDFCARQGGDEFVVVLQDCDVPQALDRAAEVQDAVSAMPFEPEPGVSITLGISVGHAMYPHDGDTFEDLLRQADNRMYLDKASRKRADHDTARVPAILER